MKLLTLTLFFRMASAALLLATSNSAPAQSISDLGVWDGMSSVGFWGGDLSGSTPTYGQTFQASALNSSLSSFTFEVQNSNLQSVSYQAAIYRWDGTNVAGIDLFASPIRTILGTGTAVFQAITISVGALVLIPDMEYIAVFSTVGKADSFVGGLRFGQVNGNPIANSIFAYNDDQTDYSSPVWKTGT